MVNKNISSSNKKKLKFEQQNAKILKFNCVKLSLKCKYGRLNLIRQNTRDQ